MAIPQSLPSGRDLPPHYLHKRLALPPAAKRYGLGLLPTEEGVAWEFSKRPCYSERVNRDSSPDKGRAPHSALDLQPSYPEVRVGEESLLGPEGSWSVTDFDIRLLLLPYDSTASLRLMKPVAYGVKAIMPKPDVYKTLGKVLGAEDELPVSNRNRDPLSGVMLYAGANPTVEKPVAADAARIVLTAHEGRVPENPF